MVFIRRPKPTRFACTECVFGVHVSSQTDKICEESLSSIMHVFSLPSSVFFQVFFYLKIYYYIFNINTLKLLKIY